LVLLTGNWL